MVNMSEYYTIKLIVIQLLVRCSDSGRISDLDRKNYLSWHYWGKIDALLNDAYGSQSGQRS